MSTGEAKDSAIVSIADLRAAENLYEKATYQRERARAIRNTIVRQAIAQGWTHARIAQATGLTRARIGQIAQGEAK